MSTPRRALLVFNPAAGGGRARKRGPEAFRRLREGGLEFEVRETSGPGQATTLVREANASEFSEIIAVGGDGTAFEVVNGLLPRDAGPLPRIGMLPLGTGNSFLRDFDITTEDAAIAALSRGESKPIDVVRAEHAEGVFHYINLLSLGFPARVGHVTNTKFKGFGAAGYGLATVSCLRRLAPVHVPISIDDDPWDDRSSTFLTFSNSRFTGGTMMMAPHADVSDGRLDVIRAHPMSRTRLLQSFPKIFRGTHVNTPQVSESQATQVFLKAPQQDVMVDGEILRVALEKLTVMKHALSVIV